jgi:hypothetical protein
MNPHLRFVLVPELVSTVEMLTQSCRPLNPGASTNGPAVLPTCEMKEDIDKWIEDWWWTD